jgi:hypothetical protein
MGDAERTRKYVILRRAKPRFVEKPEMKATEFCYWLQGMFELANPAELDAEQTDLIKRHLAMAFQHDIDQRPSAEEQAKLNHLHGNTKPGGPVMRC